MFNPEVIEKIKSYVYLYSDPDTEEIFYIGKGKGNRCFSHLHEELELDLESNKLQKIQQLKEQNKQPLIELLRYGLTDNEASLVEASWIDFIGGGGSVNLHNLFSIDAVKAIEKHKTNAYSSRIEGVFDSLSDAPIIATMISILSYIYVIVLRVLGVFGLLEMIRRKEHALLLIILGLISYFALTALFVGNSRYRLPIEIGFVVLSLYGLSFLKSIKKLKK